MGWRGWAQWIQQCHICPRCILVCWESPWPRRACVSSISQFSALLSQLWPGSSRCVQPQVRATEMLVQLTGFGLDCLGASFECGLLYYQLHGVVGSGYNGVDPDCLPGSECDQAQIEWMRKDLAAVVNNSSLSQLCCHHPVCSYKRMLCHNALTVVCACVGPIGYSLGDCYDTFSYVRNTERFRLRPTG